MNTSQLAYMVVAVFGGVLYHLAQKAVPQDLNPFAVLFHVYVVAGLLCLAALGCTSPKELSAAIARPSAISMLLGVAVFLIEAGFLFVYRSGWPIGWAALVQTMLIALILLPVGYFVYQENVSIVRLLGVGMCLGGMFLIMKR